MSTLVEVSAREVVLEVELGFAPGAIYHPLVGVTVPAKDQMVRADRPAGAAVEGVGGLLLALTNPDFQLVLHGLQCKHTFVSLAKLNRAIKARDADRSLEIARELNHVPLSYAARITALLAERRDYRYERAARRLMARAYAELERTNLENLKRLGDILAHVHDGFWGPYAAEGLERAIAQLETREQQLWLTFETAEGKRLRR